MHRLSHPLSLVVVAVQSMPGLRIEDCNDVLFLGIFDEYNIPDPKLTPPSTTADQTASVVIAGDSTGIVFKNVEVGDGPGMPALCRMPSL